MTRSRGDLIYAGGRHQGIKAKYQVKQAVSQSYLTQLWNHQAFQKQKDDSRQQLIDSVSKYFTLVVLLLATGAALYWWATLPERSLFVFTSVLIVACPCALAMATPFTLGHTLRVFGKNGLYLKNAQVVSNLTRINNIVFDKTGTLTTAETAQLSYYGELDLPQAMLFAALSSQSNHPVSRQISEYLNQHWDEVERLPEISEFREIAGKGTEAVVEGQLVSLGNAQYLSINADHDICVDQTLSRTYLAIDGRVIGYFEHRSELRRGITSMVANLKNKYELTLLSGDGNKQERELSRALPGIRKWLFKQSPMDKLHYLEMLRQRGESVMMIGDGLNDAGALQASKVGLAVTENPQHFTPACDGIMSAATLRRLPDIITLARWSQKVVILGIMLSFVYNLLGLSFAVSGNLTPLVAAVLMPVSSISVVIFTTVAVKLSAKKLGLN